MKITKAKTLEQIIREMYDEYVADLQSKNILTERQYFAENYNRIPFGEFLENTSYYDHFEQMKEEIATPQVTDFQINQIFTSMETLFLFSKGHDVMFKHKLKADCFCAVPIEKIIYPRLKLDVRSKFNDVSVMRENPKREKNIEELWKLIYNYQEFSSLLFMLYASDWQFPREWEKLFPESYDFLIEILGKTDLTIGEFLCELVSYKCDMMEAVLNCIVDPKLKQRYLNKLTILKIEKQKEIESFAHRELSVAFFLEHTIDDFIKMQSHSTSNALREKTRPKPKIIIET